MLIGARLFPYSVYSDVRQLTDYAKRIEDAGFDYLAIAHHSVFPTSLVPTMGPIWWDPIVLATHVAAHTTNIRIVFTALVLPQYQPVDLAHQLASLDAVTEGRIAVGLGVGWCEQEFEFLGVDFKTRARRYEEYIAVLRELWTRDPANFSGEFVRFSSASAHPLPVQRPHPPLYIAGGQRSVERAARLGDGWMPMSAPFDEFLRNLETLRELLPQHGRDLDNFPIFRSLPLFAQPGSSEEHHRRSGGHAQADLGGDYGAARDHIAFCEERGVTHMTAMFAVDYEAMVGALGDFEREIIHWNRR